MKTTQKLAIIAALSAGLISAAAFSGHWGHGGGGCGAGRGAMHGGPGQRAEMMQQHHAEQMELLKYRLALTPEQESAWQAFRDAQNAHHESMWQGKGQRGAQATGNAVDHFNARIQFMQQRLQGMEAVAKAAGDLYATLEPEQQQTMDAFFADRRGRRHYSQK